MFKFEKYAEKHIQEVKNLYNTYLLPKHLKRLGITKDQVTEEIMELEQLVSPEFLSSPHLRQCSMVCINEHKKLISFQLNYFLNEESFNEGFIRAPKKFLNSPNTPKNLRDYAQYVLDLYDGHDLFKKCKRYLYFESGVTLPEYRNHAIITKLGELCIQKFSGDVDGLLGEVMIEKENFRHLREDDTYKLLRRVETPGYICSLYVLYLNRENGNNLISKI